MSTGNTPTVVDLTRSPTTLIIGKNGAGKSTMLDALNFALYGKAFRSINKPQLINTVNEKELVVELEFDIGSKQFKIIRGIKPMIFEIYLNGKLLNQDSKSRDYQKYLEKSIIKMNEKSFRQIVVLGSADYVPFMQLPASHRREVIEDLLDIRIFSTMNVVLKEYIMRLRDTLYSVENDIAITEQSIKLHKQYMDSDKKKQQNRIKENEAKVTENQNIIEKYIDDKSIIIDSIEKLNLKITDKPIVLNKLENLQSLFSKIEANSKRQRDAMDFFKTNDECPTCSQGISEGHKNTMTKEKSDKLAVLEDAEGKIQNDISSHRDRLHEVDSVISEITDKEREISALEISIHNINNFIKDIQTEIQNEINDSKNDTSKEFEKLDELSTTLSVSREKRIEIMEQQQYQNIASSLLKDTGIKTKIIRQYLPIMNQFINSYLSALGLSVSFQLDENFNETIKSRYKDSFSYPSFSEGEKTRIDLALMLAWRQLAKMKNSTSTNLLIMDEVFDGSLDGDATEELIRILTNLEGRVNIFVISHRNAELQDKFRSIIEFVKEGNFSRIG